MEKKKEPLKVSIYAQKGGVGKSTMTILLASVLHYRLGYNILVLDCDFPQYSLIGIRERDKRTVMESDFHKKLAVKQLRSIRKLIQSSSVRRKMHLKKPLNIVRQVLLSRILFFLISRAPPIHTESSVL